MGTVADAHMVIDKLLEGAGWNITNKAQVSTEEAMERVKGLFQTRLERTFPHIETDTWNEYDTRETFDIVKGQVDPCEGPCASMPHVAPEVMEIGTCGFFLDKNKTAIELELKSGKYLFDASHVLCSKIRPNPRKEALPDFEGKYERRIHG